MGDGVRLFFLLGCPPAARLFHLHYQRNGRIRHFIVPCFYLRGEDLRCVGRRKRLALVSSLARQSLRSDRAK